MFRKWTFALGKLKYRLQEYVFFYYKAFNEKWKPLRGESSSL